MTPPTEGMSTLPAPYYSDDLVTLYHGDCREITAWLEADVLVTDPPYGSDNGVGYGRRQGANGRAIGETFRIANDATGDVRDTALAAWGGRPVLCFGAPRLPEPPGGWDHRLVWDRREPGMNGGPWRYTHESIFVRGEGWTRVNASSFSIIAVPAGNGTPEKGDHVHVKPLPLMVRLMSAAPVGIIADPFAGSGSTLVAAKQIGRRAIGVELEERYCEVAAKRLAQDVLDFGEATA